MSTIRRFALDKGASDGKTLGTGFRASAAMFAGLGALLLSTAAAQAADYQVYRDGVCTPNAECAIDFDVVPAGKKLTIVNFSCYLRFPVGQDVSASQLVLVRQNGSPAFAVTPNLHLQDTPQVGADDEHVFVSNEVIRAVGKPGQRFRAYAQVRRQSNGSVGTISQLSCGISGTLN
jgi:hypothetical protein